MCQFIGLGLAVSYAAFFYLAIEAGVYVPETPTSSTPPPSTKVLSWREAHSFMDRTPVLQICIGILLTSTTVSLSTVVPLRMALKMWNKRRSRQRDLKEDYVLVD